MYKRQAPSASDDIARKADVDAKPSTFLELSDTPSSYSGQAGRYLKVNDAADALEFGLAATKFTFVCPAAELWRRETGAVQSSFEAQIDGTPTSTSVVYKDDKRAKSLPHFSGFPHFGKVILYNKTRDNLSLIHI